MSEIDTLLADSLILWRLDARIDGGTIHGADGAEVRVAKGEGPFRWSLQWRQPDETWEDVAKLRFPRNYASVTGLLKGVRMALDPAWRPVRARIADQALMGDA